MFATHDLRLENIVITDGESGIKQCQNMEASNCRFYGKYPWWHVDGALIEDCYFALDSRSAIWYTNDLVMRRCRIDAPKFFREMKRVELEDVELTDADETFWKVDGLKLKNVKLHGGTYPFMFSQNIYVDGLESDSKYVFQYCKNVEIHHANILESSALRMLATSWASSSLSVSSKYFPSDCSNTLPLLFGAFMAGFIHNLFFAKISLLRIDVIFKS